MEAQGSTKVSDHERKKNNTGGSESRESEDNGPEKVVSLNVVTRFEGEGGVKKIDLLKLTKIVRAQLGK